MSNKRAPEYLKREKGPTMGCADVTIVSIAAIAAFVILILVLTRADLSSVVENFGRSNTPVVSTASVIAPTRTTIVIATPTVTAVPLPTATATPALKKALLKTNCNLRPEPSTRKGTKGEFRPGISFIILGSSADAEGIRWINVELDDGSKTQGWMWDTCFDLASN